MDFKEKMNRHTHTPTLTHSWCDVRRHSVPKEGTTDVVCGFHGKECGCGDKTDDTTKTNKCSFIERAAAATAAGGSAGGRHQQGKFDLHAECTAPLIPSHLMPFGPFPDSLNYHFEIKKYL